MLVDASQGFTTTEGAAGIYTLAGGPTTAARITDTFADQQEHSFYITDGTNFELFRGRYTASGSTLTRLILFRSSNAGAPVNWGPGQKLVSATVRGDELVDMGLMVEAADAKIMTAAERTKLAGVEAGATADQTGAEIKSLYEAQPNTNAYTDAEKTKLAGVEAAATADQTDAEIEAAYNARVAKVSGPEIVAGSEVAVRRLSPADVKAFVDVHAGGGGDLSAADIDTLAELNAILTDATLIDTTDTRLSDARAPINHSATHTNGTDDIQNATNAQKGLATAAHVAAIEANTAKRSYPSADEAKLAGIEAGATADQTDAEIEAAYNSRVAVVGQAEAEAGIASTVRRWTAQRIGQAIRAISRALTATVDDAGGPQTAFAYDTSPALANASSRIVEFSNGAVAQLGVDKDGWIHNPTFGRLFFGINMLQIKEPVLFFKNASWGSNDLSFGFDPVNAVGFVRTSNGAFRTLRIGLNPHVFNFGQHAIGSVEIGGDHSGSGATGASQHGGGLLLAGGNGAVNGNGGHVTIRAGAGAGTGARGNVLIKDLPTSATGLESGTLWNNGGTVAIA